MQLNQDEKLGTEGDERGINEKELICPNETTDAFSQSPRKGNH